MSLHTLQSEEYKSSHSLVSRGGSRIAMWFHSSKVKQTLVGGQETWVLVLVLSMTHYDVRKSFPLSRWVQIYLSIKCRAYQKNYRNKAERWGPYSFSVIQAQTGIYLISLTICY